MEKRKHTEDQKKKKKHKLEHKHDTKQRVESKIEHDYNITKEKKRKKKKKREKKKKRKEQNEPTTPAEPNELTIESLQATLRTCTTQESETTSSNLNHTLSLQESKYLTEEEVDIGEWKRRFVERLKGNTSHLDSILYEEIDDSDVEIVNRRKELLSNRDMQFWSRYDRLKTEELEHLIQLQTQEKAQNRRGKWTALENEYLKRICLKTFEALQLSDEDIWVFIGLSSSSNSSSFF